MSLIIVFIIGLIIGLIIGRIICDKWVLPFCYRHPDKWWGLKEVNIE